MSLKVSYVNGIPFVKVPFQCNFTIPKCACKIFDGKFGVSAGVFLNESPPSVREKIEKIEFDIRRLASKVQTRIEDLLDDEDFHFKLEDLKLIKNDILWGKYLFPRSNGKMTASVVFKINHIFFSSEKVSISCEFLRIWPFSN